MNRGVTDLSGDSVEYLNQYWSVIKTDARVLLLPYVIERFIAGHVERIGKEWQAN